MCSDCSANVVVAAESLGMGTVYLGSLMTQQNVELLNLPGNTYPAIGVAVAGPPKSTIKNHVFQKK